MGDSESEVIDVEDVRRLASSLGPSGMAVAVSPNNLCVWLEYFWWKGEGIVDVCCGGLFWNVAAT